MVFPFFLPFDFAVASVFSVLLFDDSGCWPHRAICRGGAAVAFNTILSRGLIVGSDGKSSRVFFTVVVGCVCRTGGLGREATALALDVPVHGTAGRFPDPKDIPPNLGARDEDATGFEAATASIRFQTL